MKRNHDLEKVTPRVMRIVRELRRKCQVAAEGPEDDEPDDEEMTACCHILNGLRLINCVMLGEHCASSTRYDHADYFQFHPESIQDVAGDLAAMESQGGRAETLLWTIEQMVCRLGTEECGEALDKYVVEVYHSEKHAMPEGLQDVARRTSYRVGWRARFTQDEPHWEHRHRPRPNVGYGEPFYFASWRDWEACVDNDADGFRLRVVQVEEGVTHMDPPEFEELVRVSGFETSDEAMRAGDAFIEAEFSAAVAVRWSQALQRSESGDGGLALSPAEASSLRSEPVVCGSTLTRSGKPCGNRVSVNAATCAAGHLAP